MIQDSVYSVGYGLKHISYEAGPGLANAVNQSTVLTKAEIRDYNADPRMKDVIINTFDRWSNYGGALNMFYTIAGSAPWEFSADILEDNNTPKLQGIDALASRNKAAVTIGSPIPATIDAISGVDIVPIGNNWLGGEFASIRTAYMIPMRTQTNSNFKVTFKYRTWGTAPTFKVWVNGVSFGTKTLPLHDGSVGEAEVLTFFSKTGLNVLRIEARFFFSRTG